MTLPPPKLRHRLHCRPRTRPARVTDNREQFRRDWHRQHTATHLNIEP